MSKTMKVIKELNEAFPGLRATPGEEFSRDHQEGIWFRGTEECTIMETYKGDLFEMPVFNDEVHINTFGTHPKLEKFLEDRGFYSEPYDSGTLMAYKI